MVPVMITFGWFRDKYCLVAYREDVAGEEDNLLLVLTVSEKQAKAKSKELLQAARKLMDIAYGDSVEMPITDDDN